MAKVKIEELIDHLDRDIRKAFEATLREHFADQQYTAREVFKTFQKQIGKKCNAWEEVPNKFIKSK